MPSAREGGRAASSRAAMNKLGTLMTGSAPPFPNQLPLLVEVDAAHAVPVGGAAHPGAGELGDVVVDFGLVEQGAGPHGGEVVEEHAAGDVEGELACGAATAVDAVEELAQPGLAGYLALHVGPGQLRLVPERGDDFAQGLDVHVGLLGRARLGR